MLSSSLSCTLPPLSIGPAERSLLCQLNKVILLSRVLPLVLSRVLLIDIFSFCFFHCMCKTYRAYWGTEVGLLSLTPSFFTSPSCNSVPQQFSITLHLCLFLSSTLCKSAREREYVCILSEKEGSRPLEVKDKQALRESFCPFIRRRAVCATIVGFPLDFIWKVSLPNKSLFGAVWGHLHAVCRGFCGIVCAWDALKRELETIYTLRAIRLHSTHRI